MRDISRWLFLLLCSFLVLSWGCKEDTLQQEEPQKPKKEKNEHQEESPSEQHYTLSFNANGGIGDMPSLEQPASTRLELPYVPSTVRVIASLAGEERLML